ncbi:hypothetical protein GOP47_0005308 [Adiantum capillus-veneris]|uniref:Uncharacterized protein n=1 Tax=Adiantum capillus-veneris TaxID=13818 RepID=A0A9D4V4W6_ADICA|nr:hypothetical protein GOP47_0005308 [Adiantum capillus-veneris]
MGNLVWAKQIYGGFSRPDEAEMKQANVEEALDKVYAERGTFDGYDGDGHLVCYRSEMDLIDIPTKHMIKEFDRYVAPKLHDQIQDLFGMYVDN